MTASTLPLTRRYTDKLHELCEAAVQTNMIVPGATVSPVSASQYQQLVHILPAW